MKKIIITASVLFLAGCASTCKIITEPPGAKVTMNGEFIGESPVTVKVPCATWGDRPTVNFDKPGFQPVKSQQLNFEPHAGHIVADLLLFGPALLFNANCVKDQYVFRLESLQ